MKFIYLYPNHNILKTIVPMIKPNIMVCQIEDENVGNKAVHYNFPNSPDMTLIHNWEASNWSSGNWVDSIGNVALTKTGSPAKTTINGDAYMTLSYNNYFQFALNNATNGLRLGDAFRIDLEFYVNNFQTSTQNYLIDFGSLTTATHAFSISISTSGIFAFNAKLTGNDTNSLYNINGLQADAGILKKISIGIERVDETNNIFYVIYNGNKYYSPNTLTRTQATFNRNFNQTTLYVGRGYIGNTNYQTTHNKYIKSIKIYKLI